MTLYTANNFTVVRQIANHTDTATYYVRAVIRNAYTDTILDTLDLTDKGSQRFKKDWKVPADPSGQGFYISIITSVYEDSGYTTKSASYGDEENTYLVADRVLGGRGGTGITFGISDIRRVIKEELDKVEKPEPMDMPEMPKMPEMKWEDILSAISEVGNKIKPAEMVDLKPIHEHLSKIEEEVRNKEVTPATDLQPIISKLEEIKESMEANHSDMAQSNEETSKETNISILKGLEEILNRAKFKIAPIQMSYQGIKEIKKEEPPLDINSLAQ